ncbi:MauE/DoxX family redox-associated membrane protein [Pedobacter sp. BAL39]|uniref:MauE/DoxX family redox-associated membrane protein n=1 Tax=Pedobacter sp. BAL39 TaxID=391596 RepID=UPI00031284D0
METTLTTESTRGLSLKSRKIIFDVTVYAFIILFIYTATSKILTINLYTVILSLLPLIGKYNETLAYLIPGSEVVVSLLLLIPVTKRLGLVCSLLLMTAFTIYITYMVLTNPHLPCTCGGVLQSLSWQQHIFFNLAFIFLALIGLSVSGNRNNIQK